MSSLADKNIFLILLKSANVFFETGTYRGDTTEWASGLFDIVYSTELSPKLYKDALERFKGSNNVNLIEGDSVEALKATLPGLNEKCFFWLDAHFSSKDTAKGKVDVPLLEELTVIGESMVSDHIIVIDDYRLFERDDPDAKEDWKPITKTKVRDALLAINSDYNIFVYQDTLVAALDSDLLSFRKLRIFLGKVADRFYPSLIKNQ